MFLFESMSQKQRSSLRCMLQCESNDLRTFKCDLHRCRLLLPQVALKPRPNNHVGMFKRVKRSGDYVPLPLPCQTPRRKGPYLRQT